MTFHLNGVGDIVPGLHWNGPNGAMYDPTAIALVNSNNGLLVADGEVVSSTPTTTGGGLPPMPGVPKFTSAEMPTFTGTAQAVVPQSTGPVLTPQMLNQKLPSIVDVTPMTMPATCDSVSQWATDNPLLAIGLLAGAAYMLWGKGHKEGGN